MLALCNPHRSKKEEKELGHLARPGEKQLNSLKEQGTSHMKTD